MKLLDINGKIVSVDIRQSTYPLTNLSKSKLQQKTKEFLVEKFNNIPILEEFRIPGSRLSLDFFIPKKSLAIEVQGEGHLGIVPFFHGDPNKCRYSGQIKRDIQKYKWCEDNNISIIEIISEKDLEKI